MASFPSLYSLFNIFFDEEKAILLLREKQILYDPPCHLCNGIMELNPKRKTYWCGNCRKEISCLKGTFFANNKLGVNKTLLLGYLWLAKASRNTVMKIGGFASHTATSYFEFFRELTVNTIDVQNYRIGGPGIKIEVDETKLGKRKYNRGHRVRFWVQ